MNHPSPSKATHFLALAAGVLIVGAFLWSTLGAFAFNGPTQNPPSGSGAIGTDASNNVYIGGNLNVTGTVTSAGGLGGSTLTAGNVSAGSFGSNTGGGNYSFTGSLGIGSTTATNPLDVFGSADVRNNLAVGTTATSTATLNVVGTANVSQTSTFVTVSSTQICLGGVCDLTWPSGGSSQWTTTSTGIYYLSGNVGVGTASPLNIFDINGSADVRNNLAVGTTATSTATLNVVGTVNISNPQGLAGPYLGTSGADLTVSSTLASSTWSLVIDNATTTAAATNYASVRSPQARTVVWYGCYDSAAATTTLNIFIPKSFSTTTVSSTINSSFACGIGGNSSTASVAIAAGSYVDVEVSSTAGTPVATFLYIDTTEK